MKTIKATISALTYTALLAGAMTGIPTTAQARDPLIEHVKQFGGCMAWARGSYQEPGICGLPYGGGTYGPCPGSASLGSIRPEWLQGGGTIVIAGNGDDFLGTTQYQYKGPGYIRPLLINISTFSLGGGDICYFIDRS